MPREASPEVTKRNERVRQFYEKNPDATVPEVASALDMEVSHVNYARTKLGLVSARDKSKKKVASSDRQPDLPSSDDAIEHLKTAVQLAGGRDELFSILEHVKRAGGIDSISQSLEQYRRLSEVFG